MGLAQRCTAQADCSGSGQCIQGREIHEMVPHSVGRVAKPLTAFSLCIFPTEALIHKELFCNGLCQAPTNTPS